MLWELKVSHANLIPPGNLARSEPLVCAEGSPGLDLRLLNGEAVITSVEPGSPAWEAGLRPGYVIQAVCRQQDGLLLLENAARGQLWSRT
jgi:S1-C subfamily serine protease